MPKRRIRVEHLGERRRLGVGEEHRDGVDQPLSVPVLAARAVTSPRTFARRFREQTGTTPHQWLLKARICRAQELLETTSLAIDAIALAAGFEAPVTFRTRFHQLVGLSPNSYRQSVAGPRF